MPLPTVQIPAYVPDPFMPILDPLPMTPPASPIASLNEWSQWGFAADLDRYSGPNGLGGYIGGGDGAAYSTYGVGGNHSWASPGDWDRHTIGGYFVDTWSDDPDTGSRPYGGLSPTERDERNQASLNGWSPGGAKRDNEDTDNYGGSWGQRPVLLDISGLGLGIETLSTSSKFLDLDGDGYQHQTAWAAQGTGVLVLDADGDGKISRSSEFAFTEWDSAATGDLEALKHIFDTNANGKLDAGDAQWSKFRVEVNGQLVTLDSLGITSIDLTPKGSGQTFEDGSAITGTTTFTRADGTTGTVGDAKLANDEAAYIVKTTSVTKADNSVEKTILAYNADGSLAFRNVVTTSTDGRSVQTQFDDDGNGTFDRSQMNVLVVDASGVQTKTVSNFNADGSLSDRTTTVTSADHLTVTTTVDQDGDGIIDQRQTFVLNADGSTTTTTQTLSINGTVLTTVKVDSSADGLIKTTRYDVDGNGVYEHSATATTTIATDGKRTTQTIDRASNNTILNAIDQTISGDGRTITVGVDTDGNGPRETKTVTASSTAANGDVTLVSSVYNTNASSILRSKTTTVTTANGLSKTTTSDVDGNNTIDFTDTDVTVIDATNRTQTVQHRTKTGTTGTLLSKTVTTTSLDGKSITIVEDENGDTKTDQLITIVVGADGATTNTVSNLNADGSLVSKTVSVSSADGLSKTTSSDLNGDGVNDLVVTDVITGNTSGMRFEAVTTKSADGTLISKTYTTTTADSLTQTVTTDADGDGVVDDTTKSYIILDATGKRTQTVRSTSADGTLKSQVVTEVSADRHNTTIVTDADGDGQTDTRHVETTTANGDVTTWERQYASDLSTISTTTGTVSGNGLTKSISADLNHDGVADRITTDQTVLNADGSKTQTISLTSSDATRLDKKTIVTSGSGKSITTSEYINADEVVDTKTTDVTTFDTYGLQFQTISNFRGTTLANSTKVTTNLNGLNGQTDYDLDGDGTVDKTSSWKKTLDPLGPVTTTQTVKAADTTLISQTITTVSADQKTTTISSKIDSDAVVDRLETITIDNAGTKKDDIKQYNASGALESQAIVTTSDDGLSKTSSADLEGNGIFELVTTDVTVLNADGSRTETITKKGVGDALISRTTANVNANGLSKTTSWADASGATVRSMSDVTTLNADGGTTETLSYFKAGGALESKTVTAVAAHGLTTTVTVDVDGDGNIDKKSVTAKQTNGSTIQTLSDFGAGNVLKDSKTVTTTADGLTQTIGYDSDGNGTVDKTTTTTTVLKANGNKATTTKDVVGAVTKSITLTEVSGDGLTVTTKWDTAGTGGGTTFDKSRTDVTVLNANGSNTQTISYLTGTTLTSRTLVTTSANGLSVTTQIDPTGAGSYSQTATDVTVLNANGTKTRTVESKKADGTLISRTITTTSANGLVVTSSQERPGFGNQTVTDTTTVLADGAVRETVATTDSAGTLIGKIVTLTSADKSTVTIDRDGNGDGVVDQHQEMVTANSGIQTSVTTDFNADGTVKEKSTVVISADGRQTTTTWDLDGNGTIDRQRVTTVTANADGSSIMVMSDNDLPAGTLAAKTTIQTSADGRLKTTSKDINGDGIVDQVETITVDPTGASVSVVTNNATAQKVSNLTAGAVYWSQAIAARIETTTSADGRSKVAKYDYDGNGVFETIVQSTIQVDGSVVTTVTETNANGTVKAKGTISTSADGMVTTLSKDTDNNGTYDHTETSVTHADGSITLTKVDLNSSGALTKTTVDQVNAFGSLSSSVSTDSLGRKTAQTIVAADGSSATSTYDGASGQQLSIANATKAGLLTSATFFDPLNTQAYTRIEQQYDAAGRLASVNQTNDDGSRVAVRYDTANAETWSRIEEYYDASNRLTNTTSYQDDGTKVSVSLDPANTTTWSRYAQYYDTAGRLTSVDQTNDNGTRTNVRYDPSNGTEWNSIQAWYDAAGKLTNQTVKYDNGYTYSYVYDVANAASWSNYLVIQDGAGRTVQQNNRYDDNSEIDYIYDYTGTNNWSSQENHYTTSGQLATTQIWMDDTSKWHTIYYDYLNQEIYTTAELNYDRNGKLTSRNDVNDDGGTTEYEYDSSRSGSPLQWWVRKDRYGNVIASYEASGGHNSSSPVLLDLSGDSHIDLRPLDQLGIPETSSVGFDWDGDGLTEKTAWVGPNDGFLAIDVGADGSAGPDGIIDQARELAFALWPENDGASDISDLDGLRLVFDTNHDNVLDANDARWSEFRIWRDSNQNGVSDAGELLTMSEAGIKLVNLIPNPAGGQAFDDGSAITGTSSYETTNGQTRLVADASLAWQKNTNGVAA
ncbi:hypothetical protein FHX08_005356 [Rhizobium sp. BK529]|uniref:hypothetical protein n=1 Tax=Rhizobium sp. BK529 TaxID=2586983 RepID=UPI0018116ABF|nr:hypothetical protein [Rhizobium sp. BK529]MBB3594946.1 hypothetical protein [Rhizobium sp. BK529]